MNDDIQTKIIISHNIDYLASYEIGILQRNAHTGKLSRAVIVFEEMTEGEYSPPTMMLNKNDLQFLIDELWALGIRPTESQDVKNIINAKNSHIDDLRKIAFKGLGVKL